MPFSQSNIISELTWEKILKVVKINSLAQRQEKEGQGRHTVTLFLWKKKRL